MAIFEYDGNANALYCHLTDKPVKGTKCIGSRVNVDYDEDGEAVGIEVLSPPGFSVNMSAPLAVNT
jgi:uncharacterized protein YuzE